MIRVVVKFKSFSIMIYKTAAAIQKILRMSADAVLFRQCFSAEFAVGLCLVQFDDSLLAILKTGTIDDDIRKKLEETAKQLTMDN